MHGAGPMGVRVRPGHAAVDGEVDFERTRTTPELAEGARNSARKPIAEDGGDGFGCEIEDRHVGGRQLRRVPDRDTGLDLGAQVGQQRNHRVGDGLRSAFGNRPAVPVAGRDDAHPDCRSHRVMQRPEGMRRNTTEQSPPLVGAEYPGERGRGKHRGRAEPGQLQWVMRDPQQRAHDVLAERVEPGGRIAERTLPPRSVATESGRGLLHRAVQHTRAAAVERMHAVDLRPAPGEAVAIQVDLAEERRADGHRMDRRAVVVQQAGKDGFAAAGAAADFVGRLEDGDLHALGGQGYGGGEPVGPAADHDRGARHT